MPIRNKTILPSPPQPAGRLSADERARLLERFPGQADHLESLEKQTNEQLADAVFELMKGSINFDAPTPRHAIHGLALMERSAYRSWSRRQLVTRLLTFPIVSAGR